MIRRAEAADAAAIAHVHRSSRAEVYGGLDDIGEVHDADWAARLERFAVWVADHHGAIVGFAAFDGTQLHHLYVLPGAQGAGAGARLLDVAMEAGVRELWVYAENARARRFYERHGWTLVPGSEMTGEDWRPRVPGVRYERR